MISFLGWGLGVGIFLVGSVGTAQNIFSHDTSQPEPERYLYQKSTAPEHPVVHSEEAAEIFPRFDPNQPLPNPSSNHESTAQEHSAPPPVERFGDPQRLEIRGAKTFPPEDIVKALSFSIAVRLAATPSADLFGYLALVEENILAGYRTAGFPHAKVRADVERSTGRVVVSIEEGSRYAMGKIQLRGEKTLHEEDLAAYLTTLHPNLEEAAGLPTSQRAKASDCGTESDEPEQPAWQCGKPALFEAWPSLGNRHNPGSSSPPAAKIQGAVREALTAGGRPLCKHVCHLELDEATKQAALVIDVLDEGPPAEIGAIEICGAKINSPDAILDYLHLRVGDRFCRETVVRAKKKLWDSARFISADIQPVMPTRKGDKLTLKIDLKEYLLATPLDKPLSPEEQVMVKCCQWLSDFQRWGGDLVVRCPSDDAEILLVYSPTQGLVVNARRNLPGEPAGGNMKYCLVFSPREIGIYDLRQRRKLSFPKPEGEIFCAMSSFLAEEADPSQPGRFSFGIGFRPADDLKSNSTPCRLETKFQPASFLSMIHREYADVEIRDGVMTVRSEDGSSHCRIEADTGRILEIVFDGSEKPIPESEEVPSDQTTSSKKTAATDQDPL